MKNSDSPAVNPSMDNVFFSASVSGIKGIYPVSTIYCDENGTPTSFLIRRQVAKRDSWGKPAGWYGWDTKVYKTSNPNNILMVITDPDHIYAGERGENLMEQAAK